MAFDLLELVLEYADVFWHKNIDVLIVNYEAWDAHVFSCDFGLELILICVSESDELLEVWKTCENVYIAVSDTFCVENCLSCYTVLTIFIAVHNDFLCHNYTRSLFFLNYTTTGVHLSIIVKVFR